MKKVRRDLEASSSEKALKAHFFDGSFERIDLRGRFGADGKRGVGGFAGVGVAHDVAEVVDLRSTKRGGGGERHQEARVAVAPVTRGWFGFNDADDFEAEFFGNDGEAATGSVGSVCRWVCAGCRGGKSLTLGVAEDQFLADERSRLVGEIFREFDLQDGFVGGSGREKATLHTVEGARIFRGVGHAGDDGGVWLVVEADLSEETDLRVDLDDVGKIFHFLARVFIEHARRLVGFGFALRTAHAAESVFGSDDNRVEEAALRKAFGGELLQPDAERKHGDERSDADSDAERGEGVAQDGFAQIAKREVGEVAGLHCASAFRVASWRGACRRP